uniref:Uncharacterized protein n=1 Tax=viral metagenome TaxID=1070528 RepID=A0A6C0JK07_9ZZZZ
MNLDLDINNYKITDLEKFLRLPPSYTDSIVIEKEQRKRSQILKSDEIPQENKDEIVAFLNKAKNLLIKNKKEEPIIKREVIPIVHTKQEEFIPSNLNPIEKKTITKSLCIDSLFRENYDKTKSTDYIYKLPVYISNVVSLQLTSFEFPNMINSFSTENGSNEFEIGLYNVNNGDYDVNENPIFSDISHTIVIPDGNYMSDTFQTMLNNLFQNLDSIGLNFLKVEINQQTNTIIRINNSTIDTTAGFFPYDPNDSFYSPEFYFKLNFAIKNKPLYKTAGWMMGFRNETYTITKNNIYNDLISLVPTTIYEGYLISESSYGSTIDNYIFVEIDDYNNNYSTNNVISTNTNSYIGKNVLARIVITSGSYTTITDNASDGIFKKREYFGPIKLEKFRIRLLNRFGDVIQIKNNDFSFVLEIKQIY